MATATPVFEVVEPVRKTTMKAIVQDRYGSSTVLEVKGIDKPEIGDREVLVRVRAAGVNPADWAIMSGLPDDVMAAAIPAPSPTSGGLSE